MSPEVIIAGLLVLPVILLIVLRVNAALVFLSLCLGDVLVQFAGHDATTLITGASPTAHVAASTIQLGLLVAPMLLTILFMIGTVRTKAKKILNVLPAAGVGLLTLLLVVPLLPPGLGHNITRASLWATIRNYESGIVALSTLVCLFFLWLQRPKHHGDDKHDKKHHK